MRKFKFIGTDLQRTEYSSIEERRPQRGVVYSAIDMIGNSPINYWVASSFGVEWEEVVEEEKVQLTETEKIVLIDFLNEHFEEFCEASFEAVNIIDKIERL